MDEPNVLLLDEPTNDLDVDTLAGLEDLLDGWPGTLVVVSHDRYLTERVCDQVVALFATAGSPLPGGIGEYLTRRAAMGRVGRRGAPTAPVPAGAPVAQAAGPKASAAEQRAARKDAQRLERRMGQLTAQEEKLHAKLAEAATEPGRLMELDRELKAVVAERESVELEWLEAAERAEG